MLCGMPQDVLDDAARARLSRRLEELEAGGVSGTVLLAEAGVPVRAALPRSRRPRRRTRPVTPDTRFQTASVTKMLTAAAVLDQVAQGRVTVQTPVVDVVPPDRRPRHLAADVTVHHLLCHTSGIADYFEEDESLPNAGTDYAALWRDLPPARIQRPVDFLPLYGELPAYVPARRDLALLQRRLRAARRAARAAHRTGLHRGDRGARAAPGRDGRQRVRPLRRAAGADRRCTTCRRGAPTCTACRSSAAATAAACAPRRTWCASAAPSPTAPCSATSPRLATQRHATIEDDWSYGYGLMIYPDGRWGHGGGDPGVSAAVNHWPERDLTVVALCNVEENDEMDPAFALRDAVLAEAGLAQG